MPRRAHSVGVNPRAVGIWAVMAFEMFWALSGSEAMGTTGVPQSLPVAQSIVLFGPTGNVPMPMSSPADCGSFTKAAMAEVALLQLVGAELLPAGGMVMLVERSS